MIRNATAQGQHWMLVGSSGSTPAGSGTTEVFPADLVGGVGTATHADSAVLNKEVVLVSAWDMVASSANLVITDGNGTAMFTVNQVVAQVGIPRVWGVDGVEITDALTSVSGNTSFGAQLTSDAGLWVITFNIIRP